MADALDDHTRISTGLDTWVRTVGADQWATRCPSWPDWDVRTPVAHVIGSHHHMLSTLGRQHADPAPDADLSAAWAQAGAAVLAALDDPATAGWADSLTRSNHRPVTPVVARHRR
ncbi:MAG: maleylpyruvate isomerase N-terminal domain-containing protein [Jatrophihabitantaceae bacterium]